MPHLPAHARFPRRPSARSRATFPPAVLASLALGAAAAVGCSPSQGTEIPSQFVPDSGAADATTDEGGGPSLDAALFDTGLETGTGPSCKDPADTDGDFVADDLELKATLTDTDTDGTADYLDPDSDADGWLDKDEAANPHLPTGVSGQARPNTCAALADTDGDGTPDVRDLDSDNDGVPDADEKAYDGTGAKGCRVLPDCDGDGVDDIIEVAAGSNPVDPASVPPDSTLYFVLPFNASEQHRDFSFSARLNNADIYFLIDTTKSMQPAIDAVASSLDSVIIPKILNGDPSANPPVPPIPGARVGIGDVRDVPLAPYGDPGDSLYRNRYSIGGQDVWGNVAAPQGQAPSFTAPADVSSILSFLQTEGAAGGGDSPEGTVQALWLSVSNGPYKVYGSGMPWDADPPSCASAALFGRGCFDPMSIPVFVVITDAPFHNGPAGNTYDPNIVLGDAPAPPYPPVSYQDTVDALNAVGAKVVGVPVDTGTPGAARSDMIDLATQTDSLYHDDAFGGADRPIVPKQDTASGDISDEVVHLVGQLAGLGLKNVTTSRVSYACAGTSDCNGDGAVDKTWVNPTISPDTSPYDATRFITKVEPQASAASPVPYASFDATTFYKVKGDADLTFRLYAKNTVLAPATLQVFAAKVQVQTPKGQPLGGPEGVKVVYFVIPRATGPLH